MYLIGTRKNRGECRRIGLFTVLSQRITDLLVCRPVPTSSEGHLPLSSLLLTSSFINLTASGVRCPSLARLCYRKVSLSFQDWAAGLAP